MASAKERKRAERREWLRTVAERDRRIAVDRATPEHLCYSATCADCGRVWISAVHPIRPNARRHGRNAYVCTSPCRSPR